MERNISINFMNNIASFLSGYMLTISKLPIVMFLTITKSFILFVNAQVELTEKLLPGNFSVEVTSWCYSWIDQFHIFLQLIRIGCPFVLYWHKFWWYLVIVQSSKCKWCVNCTTCVLILFDLTRFFAILNWAPFQLLHC